MSFFNIINPNLYIGIFVSMVNAFFICFLSYKPLQILQLNGYKCKPSLKFFFSKSHLKEDFFKKKTILFFVCISCWIILNGSLLLFNVSRYFCYCGLIIYLIFFLLHLRFTQNSKIKTPLKFTSRAKRLIICECLTVFIFSFVLFYIGFEFVQVAGCSFMQLLDVLSPIFVNVSNFLMLPFEKLNNKKFIKRAKQKLNKNTNLIKIGITGSYGKTSCKNILYSILQTKFKVCMTPSSYNTPMGICKTILNELRPSDEIFIAEMGAKRKGDITLLCNIVNPKYAIIAPIGPQHLETFKTLENIESTKNELVESLPENGFAVFLKDNPSSAKIAKNCKVRHALVSATSLDAECFASNISADENGTSFYINLDGEREKCQTILLGIHNVQNILECAILARKLGLSLKEICMGINLVNPIPHRLQLVKNDDFIIIDNSYNSSPNSCKASLECLKMFKDRYKIVVSPGLVELGEKQKDFNKEFGTKLKECADFVIVVNDTNKDAIIEGFGDFKNYSCAKNLESAKIILAEQIRKDCVVLFENDLPDNFA